MWFNKPEAKYRIYRDGTGKHWVEELVDDYENAGRYWQRSYAFPDLEGAEKYVELLIKTRQVSLVKEYY